jgi:UDP-glucose 4-epimerase
MRILITGSSGQIGTNLALRCLDDGHAVLGLDRRPNPWSRRVDTIVADLAAPCTAAGTLGGVAAEAPDVVVHLAAHAKVHELVRRPALAIENVVTTQAALEYCRHCGVPIVFSSSREVYGNIHHFETDEARADFALTESPIQLARLPARRWCMRMHAATVFPILCSVSATCTGATTTTSNAWNV